MKKYVFLIVGLLIIVVILVAVYLLKDEMSFRLNKNKPEIEKLVTISKAEISSFVFATQESANDHRLHIYLTPFVTLDVKEKEIKSFVIENFKSKSDTGSVLLIHPTSLSIDTPSRTFLFTESFEPIKEENLFSDGSSIVYTVAQYATKFNEVRNVGPITPYFGIIVKNIGSVDYEEVLARDKVFEGSRYLEYSGISLTKLNTEIQFDIKIEFEDGNRYVKRFKGFLEGERFNEETSLKIILETVE